MNIVLKYDGIYDGDFCCKIKKDKCPYLKWGSGKCTIFNSKLTWNYDELAFEKTSQCKEACKISLIKGVNENN